MKMVKQAKIPISEAPIAIRSLQTLGLVDLSAKISRAPDFRYVPISPESLDQVREMGYEIVEGEAHTMERRPYQEQIKDRLSDLTEILDDLPMCWEYAGDVAIIKLSGSCETHKERIGEAYADVLGMRAICVDRGGVSGELRQPSMEVIHGDSTESTRLENGILYQFDVSKVMFASGNVEERRRMGALDCRGETVVDMFAGIGYFTLPLSKFSDAKRVFACEKNKDSYHYLLKNIRANGLHNVIPMLGDNRSIPGRRFADRILMGYVQTTSEFLPKAIAMIKPGGTIHYHDTFYVKEHMSKVDDIFKSLGTSYDIESYRQVKAFAPSVGHFVYDITIH